MDCIAGSKWSQKFLICQDWTGVKLELNPVLLKLDLKANVFFLFL